MCTTSHICVFELHSSHVIQSHRLLLATILAGLEAVLFFSSSFSSSSFIINILLSYVLQDQNTDTCSHEIIDSLSSYELEDLPPLTVNDIIVQVCISFEIHSSYSCYITTVFYNAFLNK